MITFKSKSMRTNALDCIRRACENEATQEVWSKNVHGNDVYIVARFLVNCNTLTDVLID